MCQVGLWVSVYLYLYLYILEVFQVQRPPDNVLEKKKLASIIPIWNIRFKQANVKFFKKKKKKNCG